MQSCAIKIHVADFDTHGCDFTAQSARLGAGGGGASAYNAMVGEEARESDTRAVGGVRSPYGGKPP